LTALPGREWSSEGRKKIVEWLTSEYSIRQFLLLAGLNLPRCASAEDCEDAVQAFLTKDLDGVLQGFEPLRSGSLDLPKYVEVCFARMCWKRARNIQLRSTIEVSIDAPRPNGDVSGPWELPDQHSRGNPEELAAVAEQQKQLRKALEMLSPYERMLIIEHHLNEETIASLAGRLKKPEGLIKVHLFRARQKLMTRMGGKR
jgi:RNA polymerase sigma factor (sigma-70 family)